MNLKTESGGILVWYENLGWQKHLISDQYLFSTGQEVADIHDEGRCDIVSITRSGLIWFRNPHWQTYKIENITLHDIELNDFE
jgi:hypothetical protein